MVQQILFYLFAVLTLASALSVVLSKHPVRSVLSLVLTLVSGAVLWLLLEAEFLALILIVVYVGAVMVLFLFVVMMLDVEQESRQKTYVVYWPLVLLVLAAFLWILLQALGSRYFGLSLFKNPDSAPLGYSNVSDVGMMLFSQYLYPFEIAGVLLLSGMIAAIAFTFRGRKSGTKTQNIAKQVRVQASDRLTLLDLNKENV